MNKILRKKSKIKNNYYDYFKIFYFSVLILIQFKIGQCQ